MIKQYKYSNNIPINAVVVVMDDFEVILCGIKTVDVLTVKHSKLAWKHLFDLFVFSGINFK